VTLTLLYFPFLRDLLQSPLPVPLRHSTSALISIGTGKTCPLHLASGSPWHLSVLVGLWPFLPSVGVPIFPLPLTLWPFGLWWVWPLASRLKSTYCSKFIFLVLQVFSWRHSRENFLTQATDNTHSKIPSASPLGCLLHNLTELSLKGDLKPKNLISFSMKIWPQYKLDNSSKWPKFKTFNSNVLWDLNNLFVRNGKWQESPYLLVPLWP
jgi:hypothetical protein